ncbi:MAG: BON domain-containing protein [Burkholderiales bacterium]|nr:BON domain-containing protein [Burkholderiales bacterium]
MSSLNRTTGTLLLALAAGTTLSACAPLLIGGAIWGGTLVVSDRRTSGAQIDDQAIELKSVRRIADVIGDKGHVNVTSYNRLVLLSGEVPTEGDKAAVEQAVARIDNVRAIVNELTLAAPSSLSARSNDTLMTSKVKASMVDAKDIQANAYKVVTERGVVYLMGRVTEREANRAADIARGVSGVQKVVKVFDVVSEGELADTQPKTLAKP